MKVKKIPVWAWGWGLKKEKDKWKENERKDGWILGFRWFCGVLISFGVIVSFWGDLERLDNGF